MNLTGLPTAITGMFLPQRIKRVLGRSVPRIHIFRTSIPGVLLLALLIVIVLKPFEGSEYAAVMAGTTVEPSRGLEPERSGMGGEWVIESHYGKIQIRLYHGQDGRSSLSLDVEELMSRIDDSTESFQVVRGAGTFFFEGKIKRKLGGLWGEGGWYFNPDSSYVQAMERYGLSSDDEDKLFALAIFDVTLSFVSEMEEIGLKGMDTDNLIAARVHGITPEYVSEFFEAGFAGLSMESIVALHNSDVDPEYLRECEKQGFGAVSSDDLVILCMSEITPEYFKGLAELGYRHIPGSDIVNMKDAGITPRYIIDLAELGYKNLSPSLLVEMRKSDVTPSLIRKLRDQGRSDLTPTDLIKYQHTGH